MATDRIPELESPVRVGFWYDFDKAGAAASTLTLRNRDAVIILTLLPTLVAFAANRSWKICRFFLHQIARTEDTSFAHETMTKREWQVILRNAETAGSAFLESLGVAWQSRTRTPRSIGVGIVVAGAALLHLVLFVSAGILTSQIFTGRTVLSRNTTTCGQWYPKDLDGPFQSFAILQELQFNQSEGAHNYARNCYDRALLQVTFDCGRLAARSLPYHLKNNESCPFQPGGCSNGPDAAFVLDSGNISLRDLGINLRHSKQIFIRRKSTCTPTAAEPFLDSIHTNQDGPAYSHLSDQQSLRDYTFFKTLNETEELRFQFRNWSTGYDLRAYTFPVSVNDTWKPPLSPSVNHSDTAIILLRGEDIQFTQQYDDPFFAVHTPIEVNNSTGLIPAGYTRYRMDNFLNILVCYETAQFCSSITNQCSPWASIYKGISNQMQQTLMGSSMLNCKDAVDILYALNLVSLNLEFSFITESIVQRPGDSVLQAARYLQQNQQTRLFPEQWKVELEFWFSVALANMQLCIFRTIQLPASINRSLLFNLWDEFGNGNLKQLCVRVKFQSADRSSLSTLGIVIVLVISALLTFGSYLDVAAENIPKFREKQAMADWRVNEKLALLHAAAEVQSLDGHSK